MEAYLNDPQLKEKLIAQLQAHYDADEIIKGKYWENGKGCAIGCVLHEKGGQHYLLEERYGISRILGKLIDSIFEELPNTEAKDFTLEVFKSIPVGKDLQNVCPKFIIWLLKDVRKFAYVDGQQAIDQVIYRYEQEIAGKIISEEQWREAREAAYAARAASCAAASTAARAAARAASYAAAADAHAAADAATRAANDTAAYAARGTAAYTADAVVIRATAQGAASTADRIAATRAAQAAAAAAADADAHAHAGARTVAQAAARAAAVYTADVIANAATAAAVTAAYAAQGAASTADRIAAKNEKYKEMAVKLIELLAE